MSLTDYEKALKLVSLDDYSFRELVMALFNMADENLDGAMDWHRLASAFPEIEKEYVAYRDKTEIPVISDQPTPAELISTLKQGEYIRGISDNGLFLEGYVGAIDGLSIVAGGAHIAYRKDPINGQFIVNRHIVSMERCDPPEGESYLPPGSRLLTPQAVRKL